MVNHEMTFDDDAGSSDEATATVVFGGTEAQAYATWFDDLCAHRAEVGAREYGPMAFMTNDIMRMMIEELADTANYCKLQAVKLLAINNALVDSLGTDSELKDQEFKGTGEGWNKT
jgi:hypothetical protein